MKFDALSFAGCGTLNFYQTGVGYALQQAGLTDNLLYAGSSAGSGLAVLLASGISADQIHNVASQILAPYQGKNILLHPMILKEFADRFLQTFVDSQTLHKIGTRVHISITTVRPFKNILVNQFVDIEDLCKAIRASCHIPSVRFPSVIFRNQRCVDGGFTRNNPKVGLSCMRVSPFFFDPRMSIRPKKLTPPWWAVIVPSVKRAEKLFHQGRTDAERYLTKK